MTTSLSRRARDPFLASFDRQFEGLVRAAFGPTALRHTDEFQPAAEVHRDGDDAVIRLDLPGMSTDDVSVEVKGRDLVVSGERRDQREEDREGRHFSEFRYGSFTRSFRLAPQVKPEDVTASYDAGVLTVRVTGAYAEAQGHRIEIGTSTPAPVEGESQEG